MSALVQPALAGRYDGYRGDDLANRLGLPFVVAFETIGSTLDVAHALAEQGAAAGTLVLANGQSAGRGRLGRSWRSDAGAGIWLTLIERPRNTEALDVLSLRIGLALAPVLESFAAEAIGLKWPNDLYAGGRKLAGILIEARWRDGLPEWAAIGVGVNVHAPQDEAQAAGLCDGASRIAVLDAMVPALRAAAARIGSLDAGELRAYADRDLAAGRRCVEPLAGTVRGVDHAGALLVEPESGGPLAAVRAGSLVFREDR